MDQDNLFPLFLVPVKKFRICGFDIASPYWHYAQCERLHIARDLVYLAQMSFFDSTKYNADTDKHHNADTKEHEIICIIEDF